MDQWTIIILSLSLFLSLSLMHTHTRARAHTHTHTHTHTHSMKIAGGYSSFGFHILFQLNKQINTKLLSHGTRVLVCLFVRLFTFGSDIPSFRPSHALQFLDLIFQINSTTTVWQWTFISSKVKCVILFLVYSK